MYARLCLCVSAHMWSFAQWEKDLLKDLLRDCEKTVKSCSKLIYCFLFKTNKTFHNPCNI